MDLVFEIGCEELPAGFLKPALEWMAAEMNRGLDDARLNGEGERANMQPYATPRRLALVVTGIAARAPDAKRVVQGPPAKAAFDADGRPTKAAEGFARKLGVPVQALRVENERVVVEVVEKGLTAKEALPEILLELMSHIPFKKTMVWGQQYTAFARPVRWIAAALDGERLGFGFGDVGMSGTQTRGHRFHAPKEFPLPRANKYVEALREAHVLVDWAERRGRVWEEVERAAREVGAEPVPDEELLETVTGLVEEPWALLGHFDEAFLALPPEVLVSEMRGHQKSFAVRDAKTKRLLPAFVAVSNTRVRDPAVSRRGYERVLRARLADGKFFFDEDLKVPLATRNERLSRTVFVQGLGTQWQRVERIRELALWLHGATGRGDPATLRRAAELCKSDLATGMVGEFPELQGAMGRLYALHERAPKEVADAIFEHYLPRGAEERMPEGDTGALLGIADRLDQLVGIFGLGKEPTGTADPYGLRRAALGLLRVTLAKRYRFDLAEALREAQRLHLQERGFTANGAGASQAVSEAQPLHLPRPDDALVEQVWSFLTGRLDALWRESAPADSIAAVLHTGQCDVVSLEQRLLALQAVREKDRARFEATAATFKRIANILAQAREKGIAPMGFDRGLVRRDEPAEGALAAELETSRRRVQEALDAENYRGAYAVLSELRPTVDRFFDDVMVMHEDPRLRDNRLALLRALHELFAPLADFSKLQVEKT